METKFTRGPWHSSGFEYEPEAGWFVREAGDGRYLAVARVSSSHRSRHEIEANASLIATAPKLFNACALAEAFISGAEPRLAVDRAAALNDVLSALRDALAEARGVSANPVVSRR